VDRGVEFVFRPQTSNPVRQGVAMPGKIRPFARLLFWSVLIILLPGVALEQIANVTNDVSPPILRAGHDYVKMLSEAVNPANADPSTSGNYSTDRPAGTCLPAMGEYFLKGGAK